MDTFDTDLSLRIDVIQRAIDTVQAWPDSTLKHDALTVLRNRLGRLLAGVTEREPEDNRVPLRG